MGNRISRNYKSIKRVSAVVIFLTVFLGMVFTNIALAKDKCSDNIDKDILIHNENNKVSIEPLGLEVGESLNLYNFVLDSGGNKNETFIWLSENENLVDVSKNGIVKAKNNGTVKVYCIGQEYNYVFTIIIKDYKKNIINMLPQINENKDLRLASGKFKVFIDPGHGGWDPGAIGPSGFKEANMVLDVGLKLKEKLINKGVEVQMSRTTDVAIGTEINSDLSGRASMANSFGADVFISIHNNSASIADVSGTETFIYEYLGNDEAETLNLANKIQNNLVKKLNSNDRGVKRAQFVVLRETYMPAVLAELNFINNPEIEAKMMTSEYKDKCAQALCEATMEYFKSIIPVTGIEISDDRLTLFKDESKIINATVKPNNANNKNCIWKSSDTSIATVNNRGKITAISEGNVDITVTTQNRGFSKVVKVKVVNPIQGSRIYGNDRYSTSYEISKKGWKKGECKSVVLASGEDYPDALCAAPLAKKYSSPILLTRKNVLDKELKKELERLGANKVYVIGGYGVIGKKVEEEIKSMGINIERIGGKNRYDTSVLVARKIDYDKEVVIATGKNYPDALSIASVASTLKMPIILTESNKITEDVRKFIKDEGIEKSYVVGGKGVISEEVLRKLPNPIRLAGNTRYETNKNIIEYFKDNIKFDDIYIAVGNNYPDALSSSALASKNKNAIILSDISTTNNCSVMNAIEQSRDDIMNAYIVGSPNMINDGYLKLNGIIIK